MTKQENNLIKHQEMDLGIINRNKNHLKYAKVQTYEMCLKAIEKNGLLFKDIRWDEINLTKEQVHKLCIKAVRNNGIALQYVKEQTPEMCKEAVKNREFALMYVKEQTEELCILAVKQDYSALQYVKKQTPEICIKALKKNEFALQYVKWDILSEEQIDEICREALKHDRCLIRYIKDKDIFNIKYLEEKGDASEVIAIKEDGEWLFTVGCQRNITKETFIDRIYNTDGGFDLEKGINVHRQVYLDFLKEFK
ncbi:DUF4116 domain-containing protein [Clostridioides difficile]|nr:DUF4116 domain-containing protein [Clostridioides difficile]